MKKRTSLILLIIVLISSNTLGTIITSQSGDVGNFNSGDAADIPYRSDNLLDAFNVIGLDKLIDMDLIVPNNGGGVGYSHSFTIPLGQTITSATLTVGVRSGHIGNYFGLDVNIDADILWGTGFGPRAEIGDLLGYAPPSDITTEIIIDLSSVSMKDSEGGSSVTYNLLSELLDGEFNVILADDAGVDYSILQIETIPEPATLLLLGLGGIILRKRLQLQILTTTVIWPDMQISCTTLDRTMA